MRALRNKLRLELGEEPDGVKVKELVNCITSVFTYLEIDIGCFWNGGALADKLIKTQLPSNISVMRDRALTICDGLKIKPQTLAIMLTQSWMGSSTTSAILKTRWNDKAVALGNSFPLDAPSSEVHSWWMAGFEQVANGPPGTDLGQRDYLLGTIGAGTLTYYETEFRIRFVSKHPDEGSSAINGDPEYFSVAWALWMRSNTGVVGPNLATPGTPYGQYANFFTNNSVPASEQNFYILDAGLSPYQAANRLSMTSQSARIVSDFSPWEGNTVTRSMRSPRPLWLASKGAEFWISVVLLPTINIDPLGAFEVGAFYDLKIRDYIALSGDTVVRNVGGGTVIPVEIDTQPVDVTVSNFPPVVDSEGSTTVDTRNVSWTTSSADHVKISSGVLTLKELGLHGAFQVTAAASYWNSIVSIGKTIINRVGISFVNNLGVLATGNVGLMVFKVLAGAAFPDVPSPTDSADITNDDGFEILDYKVVGKHVTQLILDAVAVNMSEGDTIVVAATDEAGAPLTDWSATVTASLGAGKVISFSAYHKAEAQKIGLGYDEYCARHRNRMMHATNGNIPEVNERCRDAYAIMLGTQKSDSLLGLVLKDLLLDVDMGCYNEGSIYTVLAGIPVNEDDAMGTSCLADDRVEPNAKWREPVKGDVPPQTVGQRYGYNPPQKRGRDDNGKPAPKKEEWSPAGKGNVYTTAVSAKNMRHLNFQNTVRRIVKNFRELGPEAMARWVLRYNPEKEWTKRLHRIIYKEIADTMPNILVMSHVVAINDEEFRKYKWFAVLSRSKGSYDRGMEYLMDLIGDCECGTSYDEYKAENWNSLMHAYDGNPVTVTSIEDVKAAPAASNMYAPSQYTELFSPENVSVLISSIPSQSNPRNFSVAQISRFEAQMVDKNNTVSAARGLEATEILLQPRLYRPLPTEVLVESTTPLQPLFCVMQDYVLDNLSLTSLATTLHASSIEATNQMLRSDTVLMNGFPAFTALQQSRIHSPTGFNPLTCLLKLSMYHDIFSWRGNVRSLPVRSQFSLLDNFTQWAVDDPSMFLTMNSSPVFDEDLNVSVDEIPAPVLPIGDKVGGRFFLHVDLSTVPNEEKASAINIPNTLLNASNVSTGKALAMFLAMWAPYPLGFYNVVTNTYGLDGQNKEPQLYTPFESQVIINGQETIHLILPRTYAGPVPNTNQEAGGVITAPVQFGPVQVRNPETATIYAAGETLIVNNLSSLGAALHSYPITSFWYSWNMGANDHLTQADVTFFIQYLDSVLGGVSADLDYVDMLKAVLSVRYGPTVMTPRGSRVPVISYEGNVGTHTYTPWGIRALENTPSGGVWPRVSYRKGDYTLPQPSAQGWNKLALQLAVDSHSDQRSQLPKGYNYGRILYWNQIRARSVGYAFNSHVLNVGFPIKVWNATYADAPVMRSFNTMVKRHYIQGADGAGGAAASLMEPALFNYYANYNHACLPVDRYGNCLLGYINPPVDTVNPWSSVFNWDGDTTFFYNEISQPVWTNDTWAMQTANTLPRWQMPTTLPGSSHGTIPLGGVDYLIPALYANAMASYQRMGTAFMPALNTDAILDSDDDELWNRKLFILAIATARLAYVGGEDADDVERMNDTIPKTRYGGDVTLLSELPANKWDGNVHWMPTVDIEGRPVHISALNAAVGAVVYRKSATGLAFMNVECWLGGNASQMPREEDRRGNELSEIRSKWGALFKTDLQVVPGVDKKSSVTDVKSEGNPQGETDGGEVLPTAAEVAAGGE
jgi:hypothetical protein